MAESPYNSEYFQRYLERGRISGRLRGDKRLQHAYWNRWCVRRLPRGAQVIEVGCGLGFLANWLQANFRYAGLDISLEALTYARESNAVEVLVNAGATALPFANGTADAVLAFDLIEHLHEPEMFFREAARVLRTGGRIVVTTPNTKSLGTRLKVGKDDLVASMHTDNSHVALLPPDAWRQIIIGAGFQLERVGTDSLWDLPYSRRVPILLQKAVLIPFNIFVTGYVGILPWQLGENLVVVARKL